MSENNSILKLQQAEDQAAQIIRNAREGLFHFDYLFFVSNEALCAACVTRIPQLNRCFFAMCVQFATTV
jgi:hypothetical protein